MNIFTQEGFWGFGGSQVLNIIVDIELSIVEN